jgi:NAD(P)-dependent dehydrogenase (short-subunit alcohol dehydrogenase family)
MFAGDGAHVVVSGRDHERGLNVVAEIRAAGGSADFIAADLDGSKRASEDLATEATRVLGGRIDVLVNSAGIYPGPSTVDTDEATFDRVYAVNVKAPFFLTAAIAPAMAERGSGAIINLGSWIARLGIPIGSLYSSTKGAIETLTRAWAAEFGPAGVRVNAISPGVVRTPSAPDASAVLGDAVKEPACMRLRHDFKYRSRFVGASAGLASGAFEYRSARAYCCLSAVRSNRASVVEEERSVAPVFRNDAQGLRLAVHAQKHQGRSRGPRP